MMTQEQGAKYLIVGWVKDWNFSLLVQTLYGGRQDSKKLFTDLQIDYPFMPDVRVVFRGTRVRPWLRHQSMVLSDKFFDCKTDAERLALWPLILKLRPNPNFKWSPYEEEAFRAAKEALTGLKEVQAGEKLTIAAMRNSAGHAWKVVK